MARQILSGSFTLTASMDGSTFYSPVRRASSVSFLQFYYTDTKALSPSWEGNGPEFFAQVFNTQGTEEVASTGQPRLFWEGTEVTFADPTGDEGSKSGVSNGSWHAGDFKLSQKSVTIDGKTSTRWVFQVVKDIFGSGNSDDDSFYILTTVSDSSGNAIQVRSDPGTVRCVATTSGASGYAVTVDVSDITDANNPGSLVAHVYSAGGASEVTDASGQWYEETPGTTSDTEVTYGTDKTQDYTKGDSGRTLYVPDTKVDGAKTYYFKFAQGGKDYYGYGTIRDFTDPYRVAIYVDGISNPDHVSPGETAKVTARVEDNDGNAVDGYDVRLYARPAGDGSATGKYDGVTSLDISHDTLKNDFGGKLYGYATATKS